VTARKRYAKAFRFIWGRALGIRVAVRGQAARAKEKAGAPGPLRSPRHGYLSSGPRARGRALRPGADARWQAPRTGNKPPPANPSRGQGAAQQGKLAEISTSY
jgi:hypothetical protein